MKKIARLLRSCTLGFLVCAGTAVHAASPEPIQCPAALTVQQSADAGPDGWQVFNTHDKHPYVGVSFSEGPPDKKAILAPNSEKKAGGAKLAVWTLTKSAEGYWVSCLYSETSATVAKKLPDDVTYCEVEYDRNFSQPVAKRWRCSSGVKTK